MIEKLLVFLVAFLSTMLFWTIVADKAPESQQMLRDIVLSITSGLIGYIAHEPS